VRVFPWGWTVLYQLSFLSREMLLDLIKNGRIHPALTKGEAGRVVAGLGAETESEGNQEGQPSNKGEAIEDWIPKVFRSGRR